MEEKFLKSSQNFAVICSTAIIATFQLGMASLSAPLFLACMERYNVGRKEAAVPFTLIYILRTTCGPITAYFGQRYGAQIITEIGCIISVIGIGGCYFAEDITTVSIFWGGVYGLGCGFGTLLLPSMLYEFFDKHYDKAHGIYMAGTGMGNLLLPLLSEVSLKNFGTSGTFLIMSAIALHAFPMTLILRFARDRRKRSKALRKANRHLTDIAISNSSVFQSICHKKGEDNYGFSFSLNNTVVSIFKKPTNGITDGSENTNNDPIRVSNSPKPHKSENILQIPSEINFLRCSNWENRERSTNKTQNDSKNLTNESVDITNPHDLIERPSIAEYNYMETFSSNLEKNIEHSTEKTQTNLKNAINATVDVTNPPQDIKKNPSKTENNFLKILEVFADPAFIIIVITQPFTMFTLLTWYTIIIDYARDLGVTADQELYVFVSLSISDTIGRALFGVVTDKGYLSKDKFYSLFSILLAIIMCVMPCIRGFPVITIAIFLIGLLIGGLIMLNSGILIPFIPKEKLIIAMPCRLVLFPVIGFAKPFLIDYFRELHGSYNGLLFFMSGLSILTGLLTLSLPAAKRLREKREEKLSILKELERKKSDFILNRLSK